MRRSRSIQLSLVTSLASLLTSCDSRPTRYCVDENQNVADERQCEGNCPAGGPCRYHWYYGGASGVVPDGTHLSGGSTERPAGGFARAPSGSEGGTERGVIGEAGEAASAGHGGEGAGE